MVKVQNAFQRAKYIAKPAALPLSVCADALAHPPPRLNGLSATPGNSAVISHTFTFIYKRCFDSTAS